MSGIKAIETQYKGYRFRSRLEARWAVFFDALGWSWKYEHEGYQVSYFEPPQITRWLPDFYFPDFGFLAEVKADWRSASDEDVYKPVAIMDWLNGPGFLYDGGGILLLDEIPFLRFGDPIPVFPALVWSKGVWPVPFVFRGHPVDVSNGCWCGYLDASWGLVGMAGELRANLNEVLAVTYGQLSSRNPLDGALVQAATAARSARFEYGESP